VVMRRVALVNEDGKREKAEYNARRQLLRVKDLERYGIKTVLVDGHEEIPELLRRLRQRYLRRHVFVSGAVAEADDVDGKIAALSQALGRALMKSNYNLVNGLGLGVGGNVVFGALDTLYREKSTRIEHRLQLWPFPQVVPEAERKAFNTKHREKMLETVGFTVVIAGSKIRGDEVVRSNGIDEEVALSGEANSFVIPIGRTGHIAAELWAAYSADLVGAYGAEVDAGAWETLNDQAASDEEVVAAVIKIMDQLRPQ